MFSVKKIMTLAFTVIMLLVMDMPGMAAAPASKTKKAVEKPELIVKEHRTRAGSFNVAVPYMAGAVGGKDIDLKVNKEVFSYVNSALKEALSAQEVEAFEKQHKASGDMQQYNSELVKYVVKKVAAKSSAGTVTASWHVNCEYEVKSARKAFYSVLLKMKTYTGGPRGTVTWKAMNFDLKDGHLMELRELFDADADYIARLQTLIWYQQKGRARLIRHIKGKKVAEPKPVTLTGRENFYVDDHYNLGIILYSEKPETAAESTAESAAKPGEAAKTAAEGAAKPGEAAKNTAESAGKPDAAKTAAEGAGKPDEAAKTAAESAAKPDAASAGTGTAAGEQKDAAKTAAKDTEPVKIEVYDISLNDFADLIKL